MTPFSRQRQRRLQQGSILVLSAGLMIILVGFLGLVIDGGEIASTERSAQNAADGAALGAAYDILNNGANVGYTFPTNATNIASSIAVKNGMASNEVTMTYLQANGITTATAASNVAYVKADVSHNFPTLFLPVIGIDSATLTTHAKVQLNYTPPACAICVLGSSGTVLTESGATLTTYLAPIVVNSLSANAINITGSGSVVDSQLGGVGPTPAIYVGTGGTWGNPGGGTYTPTPTNAIPIADPLFGLVQPPDGGKAPTTNQGDAIITSSGNATLSPGIYGKLEYTGSGKLTFNPGTYIVTTDLLFNAGGKVDGTAGVTFYLACSSYPTPCTAGGQAGASFTFTNNGRVNLYGEAAGGEYPGMLLMADRNNTSAINWSPSSNTSTIGTIYAATSPVTIGGAGYAAYGQIVVNTLTVNTSAAMTVAYYSTQNYQPSYSLVLET